MGLGRILGRLGGILGPLGGVMEASWRRLGGVLGRLGSPLKLLRASQARLGNFLESLGRVWRRLGRVLGRRGAVQEAATSNGSHQRRGKTVPGAPGPPPLREKEPV